jgi:hypothetical protein
MWAERFGNWEDGHVSHVSNGVLTCARGGSLSPLYSRGERERLVDESLEREIDPPRVAADMLHTYSSNSLIFRIREVLTST